MALTDGLIHHYQMEINGGSEPDRVTQDANFLMNPLSGMPATVTGKINLARLMTSLSSTGLFKALVGSPYLVDNTGTVSMTVAAWVNFTDLLQSTFQVIAIEGNGGTDGSTHWALRYNQTPDRLQFVATQSDGTPFIAQADTFGLPPTGQFLLILGSLDGATGNLRVVVNNTVDTIGGHDGTMFNANAGAAIGRATNFTGGAARAAIDEVAIWNRALSPSEETDLWNSGDGVNSPRYLQSSGRSSADILGNLQCRTY